MDFFFDDDLRKLIKQVSFGVLVVGAVIGMDGFILGIKSGLEKMMTEGDE